MTIGLFKVTQGYNDFGSDRKLVCDFLLLNNTNLCPILHRFRVIEAYCVGWGSSVCILLTRSLNYSPVI